MSRFLACRALVQNADAIPVGRMLLPQWKSARDSAETKVAYHVGPVFAADGGFHVRIPAAPASSFHRCAFTPIARSQSGNNISPTPRIRV